VKITTSKENLIRTLRIASIMVGSGDDLKSRFLFRLRPDGKVEVLANNVRIFGSVLLECDVADADADADANISNTCFTVEADRLNHWLSAVQKGTVSLQLSQGKIVAKAARGYVTFPAMDPTRFPYWDEKIKSATSTSKISVKRLHHVLEHAQMFVSGQEQTEPEISACEFREGMLYATDSASATIVHVVGMDKSIARIAGKADIGKFMTFLEMHKEEEIEFLEHPLGLFLRTSSGNVMGQTRHRYDFPEIALGAAYNDAQNWWTFNREEMVSAIEFIIPSAVKDREQLQLVQDGVGNIQLSLVSAAGGKVSILVPCPGVKTVAGATPLPPAGFPVSYRYFLNILRNLRGEMVTLATSPVFDDAGKPAGGYCAFQQELETDEYLMVLGWYEE
jgi:hypothetical protein